MFYNINKSDHTTHVSGIIGAVSNNDKGINGVAQTSMCRLGNDFERVLQHATNNNIRIINASKQIPGVPTDKMAALIYAYGIRGGIIVCSAGNDGNNVDKETQYPAAYSSYVIGANTLEHEGKEITNVISVGATDRNNERAQYSNYGYKNVQLYAPGGGGTNEDYIVSLYSTNKCVKNENNDWECVIDPIQGVPIEGLVHKGIGYHGMSGTSMAAPHVTGVIALMLSINKNLTVQQIKDALLKNCDNIDIELPPDEYGRNVTQTVKFLNAFKALASLVFETNGSAITGVKLGHEYSMHTYIPDSINGVEITEIADRAFYDFKFLNIIWIPDTITSIGYESFAGCSNLEGIYHILPSGEFKYGLSDNITEIGIGAFSNCIKLTWINIPRELREIHEETFMNCETLDRVDFHENGQLDTIEKSAFEECYSLRSIEFPSSLRVIGERAFYGCGLEELVVPDTITRIYCAAFMYCPLYSISLPFTGTKNYIEGENPLNFYYLGYIFGATVYINQDLFIPVTLKEVTITKASIIPDRAFYGAKIEKINLPNTVTKIEENAFSDCTGLTSIIIPTSVKNVGLGILKNCNNLTGITLPFIGSGTLGGFTHFGYIFGATSNFDQHDYIPNSLKTVQLTSSTIIKDSAFIHAAGLQSILLPNTLTTIEKFAFAYCDNLTSIIIPSNVTNMGNNVFFNELANQKLTIYAEASTKPSGWDSSWNYLDCPVIWGCVSADKSYVESFAKTTNNISNPYGYTITEPYRKDYAFVGWYATPFFTGNGYDADQIASAPNSTYYAKWASFKIQFNLNGGTGNFSTLGVNVGDTIDKPAAKPIKSGYAFRYWALSTDITQEYNWSSPVVSNITLVAVYRDALAPTELGGCENPLVDVVDRNMRFRNLFIDDLSNIHDIFGKVLYVKSEGFIMPGLPMKLKIMGQNVLTAVDFAYPSEDATLYCIIIHGYDSVELFFPD